MKLIRSLAVVLVLTPAAFAGTHVESGDAGDLTSTGQLTVGSGSLDTITGTLPTDADNDLLAITITNPGAFFANLTPLATFADPDIWLFDAAGFGLSHSDIVQGGSSTVSGANVLTPGLYYVGVSSDGAEAFSLGGQMWSTGPANTRGPDGPGALLPLTSWGGLPFNNKMNYSISLVGATFAVVPEPTSLAALAVAGTLLRRRRTSSR